MNNTEFDKVVEGCIDKIKSVLQIKSKEYSSDDDKLHNFNKAKELMRCNTKEYALWGMFAKHLVSITDMVEKYEKYGILPDENMVEEKIGDGINYFVLLKACFLEDISIKENGWTVGDIKSIRERIGKMDKLGVAAKFICGDCANQKTCNEIGIIKKGDEATSCIAFKSKWEKKVEEENQKKQADITKILKQNEGVIANSMYQNPRKKAVVDNMQDKLKPIIEYLQIFEPKQYQYFSNLCFQEMQKHNSITDNVFYKTTIDFLNSLMLPDKDELPQYKFRTMKQIRDSIVKRLRDELEKM